MSNVQEYSTTEAGLQELRQRMQGVVYDVTTTTGMKQAREDRRECVSLRTSLEAMRKEIKAPALERCKAIDSEAKRITEEILKLEAPIDETIKAEEAKKAAEKADKERIEKERVEGIKAKIEIIKGYPLKAIDVTATRLAEVLPGVESLNITEEEYQEFTAEAQFALMESVSKLRKMLAEKQACEAEVARFQAEKEEQERRAAEERSKLEAERAELERIRKEDEARHAEEDRKLREVREAEEAELRAKREAEEKRIADERAELERQQRELEEARAKAEAEDKVRQEAEVKRIAEERARVERMITCPKCGHEFDREEVKEMEAA